MTDKNLKTRHDRIIHNEQVKLWSHTLSQVGVLAGVGGWAIAGIQWFAEHEATNKQIWGALTEAMRWTEEGPEMRNLKLQRNCLVGGPDE